MLLETMLLQMNNMKAEVLLERWFFLKIVFGFVVCDEFKEKTANPYWVTDI